MANYNARISFGISITNINKTDWWIEERIKNNEMSYIFEREIEFYQNPCIGESVLIIDVGTNLGAWFEIKNIYYTMRTDNSCSKEACWASMTMQPTDKIDSKDALDAIKMLLSRCSWSPINMKEDHARNSVRKVTGGVLHHF